MAAQHHSPGRSRTASRGIAGWIAALGIGAVGIAAARRARRIAEVDPELRVPLIALPMTYRPFTRAIMQWLAKRAPAPTTPSGVEVTERWVPGPHGAPDVRVIVCRRERSTGTRPGMLWMHGGGYVFGTPELGISPVARILAGLDMVIVSVDYRLSPKTPFPGPLDDCYAALTWLAEQAGELGIDPDRIAIGGQSAGGGLAAALVQRTVDQGPVRPVYQALIYPMLDAATTTRKPAGGIGAFIWNAASNHYGWASYLGRDPRTGGHPQYAVPADREDLSKLPSTWIGVGTLDLFADEDLAYARRLKAAGVQCDTIVIDRAYHGFDDANPRAAATNRMYESLLASLSRSIEKSPHPTDL